MATYHDALSGPDSIHPAAFVDAVDPATIPANQVGPYKWWVDLGGATPVLKYRNATNTGWIPVTTTDHGVLVGLGDDDHPQYARLALVDAVGDLLVGSAADALARLPLGTVDHVLTADPGSALGVSWQAPPPTLSNPMVAAQDLIVGGAAGSPARLASGTSGQVLGIVSGVLTWVTPATGLTNPMTTPGDLLVGGVAGAPGRLGVGTAGQLLAVVAGAPAWAAVARYGALEFTLGDGVNALAPSEPPQWLEVPFAATITAATLTADVAGSVVVDVQVASYATYPPDAGDSVCGSAKPTLAAAAKSRDTTLTGWTTTLSPGDYLRVVVESAATVQRVVLSLAIEGV